MDRVVRQHQIVSDLFPTAIRDKLMGNSNDGRDKQRKGLDEWDVDGEDSPTAGSAPLAELYPNTTVIFAGKLELVGCVRIYQERPR